VKPICVPDSRKKYNSHAYLFYVKLRKISIELSEQATQYNALREQLVEQKSAWGKTLPILRCNPEPMSEEEYKFTVRLCEDYFVKVWARGGGYDLQPSGLQYQFYQHYNG
jgi:glutathionylspermidine synthase